MFEGIGVGYAVGGALLLGVLLAFGIVYGVNLLVKRPGKKEGG